jgi:hypothetical protein
VRFEGNSPCGTAIQRKAFGALSSEWKVMKTYIIGIAAAALLGSSNGAFAKPSNTYQVTGPILEMNDTMIAVQKGAERWELTRDASTRANGDMKVGDKVTVTYTMTATRIDAKGAPKGSSASTGGAKAASTASPAAKH